MQIVAIDKFDGLLNDICASELIADNECSRIFNMQLDASMTYPRTRPGTEFVNKTSQYFNSMFMFLKSTAPDSPYLIMTQPNTGIFQSADGGATITNITGTAAVTSNPFYFKTMNDTVIGVTYGQAPIKWDGAASSVSALNASAPNGKYIEIWNSRCWIADTTNPNRVYFSKVGDSTDWTTAGVSGAGYIEVGYNDGDVITGLVAHRERLFILKRYHIYQIITANPNTDNTLWRLELFTKEGGCVSARTIQLLNNDILFLSQNGVVSLNTIQTWGDFSRSVISRNIAIPIAISEGGSSAVYIGGGRQQYWLVNAGLVWVGEQNKQGTWVWTTFGFGNGAALGSGVTISAMCQTTYNGYPVILIANRGEKYSDNTYGLYRYPNSASTPAIGEQTSDLPAAYRDDYNGPSGYRGITAYMITKFFSMNSSMSFKKFYAWALRLVNTTKAYGSSAFSDSGGTVSVTIYGDPQVGGPGAAVNKMVDQELVPLEPWGTSNLFAAIKVRWSRFSKKRNATGLLFKISVDTNQPESNWIGFGVRGLAFKTSQLNERHVWS